MQENSDLVTKTNLVDAEPREIYIIGSLLVPIIGIGLYPRLMTDSYSASIEALVRRDVQAMERITKTKELLLLCQMEMMTKLWNIPFQKENTYLFKREIS